MDVLVQDGIAWELFPNGAPELHAELVVIKDYQGEVLQGYIWDGSQFSAPPSELDNLTYVEKRELSYPTIGDQLDALFHAGVFPEYMAAQIQAVKDKYQKV